MGRSLSKTEGGFSKGRGVTGQKETYETPVVAAAAASINFTERIVLH